MRLLSTPRLNTLPHLHLEPITWSSSRYRCKPLRECKVSNLGGGFALRCFQRLSCPNIAARRFTW